MDLSGLLPLVEEATGLASVREDVARSRGARVLGVAEGAKAATIAALASGSRAPVLVVAPRPHQAVALADEVATWLGRPDRVLLFPERDALPYERLAPDPLAVRDRLRVLDRLANPDPDGPPVVIASGRALVQRTLSAAELADGTFVRRVGDGGGPEGLLRRVAGLGYAVTDHVEAPAQAARRGGIVDLWPPACDLPVRIEYLGDAVDSLRLFDPASQRSRAVVDSVRIGPAREVVDGRGRAAALVDRLDPSSLRGEWRFRFEEEAHRLRDGLAFEGDAFYVPLLASHWLLDHAPRGTLLIVDEPADLQAAQLDYDGSAEAARRSLEDAGELPRGLPFSHLRWPDAKAAMERYLPQLRLSRWVTGDDPGTIRLSFGPPTAYGGRIRDLAAELRQEVDAGATVVLVSQQSRRLAEVLAEQGIVSTERDVLRFEPGPGALIVIQGSLPHGWSLTTDAGARLVLLTDAEVFGFAKQRRAPPRTAAGAAFQFELTPGDYAVHIEHGIGRFAGLVQRSMDGVRREYLELQYAGGDRLYVPAEQADRVTRYVGPGDHPPQVARLGSAEWPRTKRRVQRAVADLVRELLDLYASREVAQGHAFSPDTPWQQELEASFPYIETPDQLQAVRAVKADMESPRPMDRLVCGDVGYGKTEVAVRAAFKAVMDGMQVAVLVPTTVLAQQHFNTFRERLAGFPVTVEMLSRFRPRAEQQEVVERVARGAVDIVIGTHRLLQKDVRFKNLGLVVIDEEQRFGVAHKERLKQMRTEVDVLTLSATPIPRTLHMSLSGIRDLSTIETPPEERLPIRTYVDRYDDRLVRDAILREVERGGQVYFVHNRVQSIETVCARLRALVPEATFGIGHGQMPEEMLEQAMLDFVDGKTDVLVCTTIIESGLDIPNVNTIIINDADQLGLAQLYQLRGRVGRGAARAHAYLLYKPDKVITEAAQKRLQAIFEATELGAGFQIALRDLEIRGAGNLLGAEQSGHIGAVGFDLYVRLLAEAVERLRALRRGEQPAPSFLERPPLTIDLPVTAFLPETYVPDLNQRLALYQRMAAVESLDQAEDLANELEDRFGPPPPPVRNLLWVVRLRALARIAGASSIQRENGAIVVRTADRRDLRSLLRPGRDGLDGTGAVYVGQTQLRLDVAALGGRWQEMLLRALEALAAAGARAQAAQAARTGV